MRRPVRKQKHAVRVAFDPRGKPVHHARQAPQERVSNRPPLDIPQAVDRLSSLIVGEAVAKHEKKQGRTPETAPRSLKDQAIRLRTKMVTDGPETGELVGAVTRALNGQGRRLLRTAERAHVSTREYAIRVGPYLSAFVVGQGIRDPAALVRAGSSALNDALADCVRDLLWGSDPTVGIGARKSQKIDGQPGATISHDLPTFSALLKLYTVLTREARSDALAAAHLEQSARAEAREQERQRLQRAWQTPPAPALPPSPTTPPAAITIEHDDAADEEPGLARTASSPRAGQAEHGANPGADTPLAPGFADDRSNEDEDPEPKLHADDAPEWCTTRLKMVPASWVRTGRRPAGATDGMRMVEVRDAETRDFAEWKARLRAHEQALADWRWRRAGGRRR